MSKRWLEAIAFQFDEDYPVFITVTGKSEKVTRTRLETIQTVLHTMRLVWEEGSW